MKKSKWLALILAGLLVFSMFAACSNDTAAEPDTEEPSGEAEEPVENTGETYILRIGTATGGVHPQNVWMEAYEIALEEATEGQIDVQLYPAGQLGNMAELIQGLRDGTVDSICLPTCYYATTFPVAATIDLSFMFDSSEQLWSVLSNNDTLYEQAFLDNGIIPVAWLRAFERTLISSKQVTSLADIKNLKIWCMPSAAIQKEVELLGGITSNLDVGELAPSIQNGTVDGAISDVALYIAQSLHTAGAKYLIEAPNDAMISLFAVSPFWFDKLPDDLKTLVTDVALQVVEETEYPYVETMQQNALGKMVSEGLIVTTPTDEQMAEIKEALMPQHDWFLETYPDAQPIYDEFVQLVEAERAAG
jgi:C4-dicarboxylate-binding protein DctP